MPGISLLFIFINQKLEKETILEQKGIHEFKQYQEMFNCLQEGILVVKEQLQQPIEGAIKQTKQQFYFVNDMGNRMLSKVYGSKNYRNDDHKIHDQSVPEHQIFYEYKCRNSQSFNQVDESMDE